MIPYWAGPRRHPGGPVRTVSGPGYRLDLPAHWDPAAVFVGAGHRYLGPGPLDRLTVTWASGEPEPYEAPGLLTWRTEPQPDWADRLGMRSCETGLGLARSAAGLARVYLLTARTGRGAWQVTLSLSTTCTPSASEDLVQANDHVRAGATFGTLALSTEEHP